jgi:hypothetical protein
VYNLETYLPITSNSDLFCTHNKAIEISVFVSVWDNSDAKLIFLWVYYCKTYSVDSNWTFQWLGYSSSYSKYNTSYRCFLSFNACSCLVHVTLYHVSRRSPLHGSLGSSCHQLPSFQDSFFERFRQLRLLNRVIFQFDHGQIPLCATLWSILSSVVIDESTVMWTLPLSFWFLGWFQGFLWFL